MRVRELVQYLQSTNQDADIEVDIPGTYPPCEIINVWSVDESAPFVIITAHRMSDYERPVCGIEQD